MTGSYIVPGTLAPRVWYKFGLRASCWHSWEDAFDGDYADELDGPRTIHWLHFVCICCGRVQYDRRAIAHGVGPSKLKIRSLYVQARQRRAAIAGATDDLMAERPDLYDGGYING